MDEKPPEKPTVKFAAVTDRALIEDIRAVVKTGFADTQAEVRLVSADVASLSERVIIIEKWKVEADERATKHSGGARQLSTSDASQDAAIAKIMIDVSDVKTDITQLKKSQADQTEMISIIYDTVVKVATNKKVIFVGKVIFALAIAYSAAHGLKVLP